MKKWGKKTLVKKSIWTLVVTVVLICTSFSVIAEIVPDYSTSNNQMSTPLFVEPKGNETILTENFSAGSIPPSGWTLKQTDPSETWYLDSTFPHGDVDNCATVHRANSQALQDEWLITPQLDLRHYTGVNLTFWWYTSCYAAHWKDYIDLNVQVSTDNGTTWKLAWSDDYIHVNYSSWTWMEANRTKPIDLQQYAGKKSVMIGFQYYSSTSTMSGAQEVSIDDIWLYGNTTRRLNISAGGPYYWCWENQNLYYPAGVRFHGKSLDPPYSFKQTWYWDFGDNGTSRLPMNPIHLYGSAGTYNVTLSVVDNTYKPALFAIDHTQVHILVMGPPEVDIQPPTAPMHNLLFGIQVLAKNGGVYNATNITWNMTVNWGLMQTMQVKQKINGTIEKLAGKTTSDPIKSGFFIAFGPIHVIVNVNPENLPWVTREFKAFKIGPFVLFERLA